MEPAKEKRDKKSKSKAKKTEKVAAIEEHSSQSETLNEPDASSVALKIPEEETPPAASEPIMDSTPAPPSEDSAVPPSVSTPQSSLKKTVGLPPTPPSSTYSISNPGSLTQAPEAPTSSPGGRWTPGRSADGKFYGKPSELITPRGSIHHDFISTDSSGLHLHHDEGHQQHLTGSGGSEHTIELEEASAFSIHINNCLENDPVVAHLLPLRPDSDDIFERMDDGLIMIQLINLSFPGKIDLKHVNKGKDLSIFKKQENLNKVLKTAEAIGCHVVNIGSQDIISGRKVLILGLIWQLINVNIMSGVSLIKCPELGGSVEPSTPKPDEVLMRWVNFHLRGSGSDKQVKNFSTDFRDPIVFHTLLAQLDKNASRDDSEPPAAVELQADPQMQAKQILERAASLGVKPFIQADALASGKNSKLLMSFAAQLFHAYNDPDDNSFNIPPTEAAPNPSEATVSATGHHVAASLAIDTIEVEAEAEAEAEAKAQATASVAAAGPSTPSRAASSSTTEVLTTPSSSRGSGNNFSSPSRAEAAIARLTSLLDDGNSPLAIAHRESEKLERMSLSMAADADSLSFEDTPRVHDLDSLSTDSASAAGTPFKLAGSESVPGTPEIVALAPGEATPQTSFGVSHGSDKKDQDHIDLLCLQGVEALDGLRQSTQRRSGGKEQQSSASTAGADGTSPISKLFLTKSDYPTSKSSLMQVFEQESGEALASTSASSSSSSSSYSTGSSIVCSVSAVDKVETVRETCSIHLLPIRLIQHRPAWALHAMLRTFGLPYTSENADTPISLGVQLPILVVEGQVVGEQEAWSFLVQLSAKVGFTPSRLPSQKDDQLWSAFIDVNMRQPLQALKQCTGEQWMEEDKARRWNITSAVSSLLRFDYLKHQFALESIASLSRDKKSADLIISQIDRAYQTLSSQLDCNQGSLCSTSDGGRSPSQADCLLIEHFLHASASTKLAPLFRAQSTLRKYADSLLQLLFSSPDQTASTLHNWRVATNSLKSNSFITRHLVTRPQYADCVLAQLDQSPSLEPLGRREIDFISRPPTVSAGAVVWTSSVKATLDVSQWASSVAKPLTSLVGLNKANAATLTETERGDLETVEVGVGGVLFCVFIVGSLISYSVTMLHK